MQKLAILFITLTLSSMSLAKFIPDDVNNQPNEGLRKMAAENIDVIESDFIKAKNDYINLVQRLKLLESLTKDYNPDLEALDQIVDLESRSSKGKPKRKTFFVGK